MINDDNDEYTTNDDDNTVRSLLILSNSPITTIYFVAFYVSNAVQQSITVRSIWGCYGSYRCYSNGDIVNNTRVRSSRLKSEAETAVEVEAGDKDDLDFWNVQKLLFAVPKTPNQLANNDWGGEVNTLCALLTI